MSAREPLRCLCLAGPTASGKSAAALAIAELVDAEIISVDSALVYRDLDIGTAKPTTAERAAVPHHLIDIVEPTEAYSAARFAADAQRLIGEIAARGRLPLLVGGTMLYFKALFDGLDPLPPADARVRAEIDALAVAEGWPAVHAELQRVDPTTAARLNEHVIQNAPNVLAGAAAIASLRDEGIVERSIKVNEEAKSIVIQTLDELGLDYLPTNANFLMHRIDGDLGKYIQRMRDRGIRVGRPFPPMLSYNRLSLGLPREMEQWALALREFRQLGWV